jgi:hypothetical protein
MNPNHDERGRFSDGGGSGIGSVLGAGSKERNHLNLLRTRLAEGHISKGERGSIERRVEKLSKMIMDHSK